MIKKIFLQSIVSAMLFLIVLFSFSRVDWLSVFDLRETVIEEKLGDMYWDLYSGSAVFLESDTVLAPLDSLLSHLCEANDIERDKIKLHVVQSNEVNAFAFPDNHLVVFTSLIAKCENQEELCGVMAHEIAHMQKGHIMKKLVKEVGLSALVGMASGGQSGEVLRSTAKLLSSTAYDRTLESEADKTAVFYLLQSGINPEPFGEFLFRLSKEEELPSLTEWVSTHPDSEKRSIQICNWAKEGSNNIRFVKTSNSVTFIPFLGCRLHKFVIFVQLLTEKLFWIKRNSGRTIF